jgi:hypothetical protein
MNISTAAHVNTLPLSGHLLPFSLRQESIKHKVRYSEKSIHEIYINNKSILFNHVRGEYLNYINPPSPPKKKEKKTYKWKGN